MAHQENPEIIYKILIVGPPSVGKTCLIRRYVHGVFTPATATTIMVDFSMKVLVQPDRTVNLRLWDIQGQEQPGYLGRTYYGGAVGAMIVWDVTKKDSLQEALAWKKDIDSKVFLPGESREPIPTFLCCNKCDLVEPNKAEMESFCEANGFAGWMATSGMKDIGVSQAFSTLVNIIDRSVPKSFAKGDKEPNPFPNQKPKKEDRCRC
jgi:small GTP-binding protein